MSAKESKEDLLLDHNLGDLVGENVDLNLTKLMGEERANNSSCLAVILKSVNVFFFQMISCTSCACGKMESGSCGH